jgi:hypothetical protein
MIKPPYLALSRIAAEIDVISGFQVPVVCTCNSKALWLAKGAQNGTQAICEAACGADKAQLTKAAPFEKN